MSFAAGTAALIAGGVMITAGASAGVATSTRGVKGARAAIGSFDKGGRAAAAIAKVKEMEAIKRSQAYAQRFYGARDPYNLQSSFMNLHTGSARFLP